MDAYTYRHMEEADYDEVFALWSATDGIHLNSADSAQQISAYLAQNPQQSYVCLQGGRIVGTVLCGNDGRRAFLYHLAVAPAARGAGIGKTLAEMAMARQKELGIEKCALFVEETNTPGKRFWQKLGFTFVPDADTMTKTL